MVKALIVFFIAHFIADFLLQSRKMGKEKSENSSVLFDHLAIVFLVTSIALYVFGIKNAIEMAFANVVIHGMIDWNIWKIYKMYAMKKIQRDAQELASAYGFSGRAKSKEQIDEERRQYLAHAANMFKYWEDHWFYVTIGFDQLLHAITMIVLVSFLG